MDAARFEKVFDCQVGMSRTMLLSKAREYATGTDRLANFKTAAKLQNCWPEQALGGMLAKHIVSIFDMLSSDVPASQYSPTMWDEKITDAMNYLILLQACLEESRDDNSSNVSV